MPNKTRKQILLTAMISAEQATAKAVRYIMQQKTAMALDSISAAKSFLNQLESIGVNVSELQHALQDLTAIALAA